MKRIWFVLLPALMLYACSSTLRIPSPDKTAGPLSINEEIMIQEGIEYHGRGEYDKAIAIYTEVLQENPHNVLAMYEIAFSLFRNGDNEESLRYALKGLEYDTDYLNLFYTLAGNNLDIMGRSRDAISVYEKGIASYPDDFMLYYNLGITYINARKYEAAAEKLQQAIALNPHHSSSHIALAEILMLQGNQIPALLLINRFLILEPNTARSSHAVGYIDDLVHWGVEKRGETSYTINLSSLLLDDQSPYAALEMVLRLRRAASYSEVFEDKSVVQMRVEELSMLFSSIGEREGRTYTDFTANYLFPYFAAIHNNGHSEAFIYYIHQSAGNDEVNEWLRNNGDKVDHFLNWNGDYIWSFE